VSVKIQNDIQGLTPSAIIVFYVLDLTDIGGGISYFHCGTNELGVPVVWQGITYSTMPIMVKGFDKSGTGRLPRPTLSIANISGAMGALARDLDDLQGGKLIRRRTLAAYLDAVNFPGGLNPSADSTEYFDDDIFYIEQKTNENKNIIEFALAAKTDVDGTEVPARVMTQTCGWTYRGEGCLFAGGAIATEFNIATSNIALDKCAHDLVGCKMRWGANAVLPYGGFPALGLIR
jgi:lambda family phage minor tail protein L